MIQETFFYFLDYPIFIFFMAYIVGGCLGSFANMLIYRLPNRLSLFIHRSLCLHCHHHLSLKELIPVFSFLFQKGHCNYCLERIPLRYLWVELSAIVFAFLYLFPSSPVFLNHHFFVFIFLCIVLFFTDIETFTLPLPLSFSLVCLGVFHLLYFSTWDSVFPTVYIVTALYCVRALFNWIYKVDTFGLGDIIFVGVLGLNWGWIICLSSLYFSILTAGLLCCGLLIFNRRKRLDHIAFCPFLIIGFLLSFSFSSYLEDLLLF